MIIDANLIVGFWIGMVVGGAVGAAGVILVAALAFRGKRESCARPGS